MRRSRRAQFRWATASIAWAVLGLSSQNCAVMSSTTDCAERATCPDTGGAGAPDSTAQGDVAMAGDGKDDGADQTTGMTDDGPGDATSVDGLDSDATSDTANADTANADAEDALGKDGARDVVLLPDGSDGCNLKPEDCTNGIDDNCDGRIDCADPECAAYACAPPVPTGWSGPVALAQTATPAMPPACQASYGSPVPFNAGLNPPLPATCGTCTCGASGQTCSATVNVNSDTSCSAGCGPVATTSGVCAQLPACAGLGTSFSVMLPPPTISGGSCVPRAVPATPTRPPVSWMTAGQVCSYVGTADSPGGCAVGAQCMLAPTGSYGTKPCVYSTATPAPTACPAGYTRTGPTTFSRGATDGRDCTSCSCTTSSPAGGVCSGSLDLFSTSAGGCNGTPAAVYTMNSACNMGFQIAPKAGYVGPHYTVSTPGTCAAVQTQLQPTGTVTAAMPITVCCM